MSTRTQELAHRPKIKTIQDAVRRVREFNEQMQDRIHDLRASVGGTAFWVYEPITGDFAPSSFCRFAAVTVLEYVQKGAGFQSAPRDSVIPATAWRLFQGRDHFAQACRLARKAFWA
jgi:hypothetical protein